jgi:hypothetical protein
MQHILLRRAPCLLKSVAVGRTPATCTTGRMFSSIIQEFNVQGEEVVMKTASVSPLGDEAEDKNKFYEISGNHFQLCAFHDIFIIC